MILITGAPRSGTSLVTQIIHRHGFYLGDPRSVNGLYENEDIRENVLKRLLRDLDADPLGQSKLPPEDLYWPEGWSAEGLRSEVAMRFKSPHERKAYKDCKITLTWWLWHEAFPDAKWIIVRRERNEIVNSCIRTSFMRAHGEDRAAWAEWVKQHERRFTAMHRVIRPGRIIEVWPREFIDDPNRFAPVADFCGVFFNRAHVNQSVDRSKYAKV